MRNVFIAIGGSGTKVAEALVRLLGAGFPVHGKQNGFGSAGHKLEIWRVDPDRSSGSLEDLRDALLEYREIQDQLTGTVTNDTVGSSRWAMDIETKVRDLDPLELPRNDVVDGEVKSLRALLDSRLGSSKSFGEMLTPFYQEKDLDVKIDRGFYQKPFIGSAVMAIFANSLEDDSTPAGRKAGLNAFANTPANFFLCGSLHGGTGACGVPVMAQFLSKRKQENPGWGWKIGGGLLAPFVKPPSPPFGALSEDEVFDESMIAPLLDRHQNDPAFKDLNNQEKEELVKQILLGFFADPDDMEERARQGLAYYKDHSAEFFDQLYLIGKPNPNQLKQWSNGGKSQKNPLNSADVVAAISALNFFAGTDVGGENSYVVGTSMDEIPQEKMKIHHLPNYKVDGLLVEVEKVLLSTALTMNLIRNHVPWEDVHVNVKNFKLCAFYDEKGNQADIDRQKFEEAFRMLSKSIFALIRPHTELLPTGWDPQNSVELGRYLSLEPQVVNQIAANLKRSLISKAPKGVNRFGFSEVKFTDFDFSQWCPAGDQFTRGEYFRHVWNEVFKRCETSMGVK